MRKCLFLVMVGILIPLCSFAVEQGYAVFDSETGTLTFKYGEKPDVENVFDTDDTWGYPGWSFIIVENLNKVVFDASFSSARPVTTKCWFQYAESLSEIVGIEYLNTSDVNNMSYMFSGCKALTNLDVTHFETNNVTDMAGMFEECGELSFLDVSSFDTGNVTDMSNMFCRCSKLTTLDVSKFDTKSVTKMSGMFFWCSELTTLDVSKFDTSDVVSLSSMFDGCEKLTSLDISHFDTGNVVDFGCIFQNCSGLTSLDVSNFDTKSAMNMNNMFAGCRSLTSLDVSNFDTSNVASMIMMFSSCSSLTDLDVSHFDTSKVTSLISMFFDCKSLTNLDVSGFNTENVSNMREMFVGCRSLTTLDLKAFHTSKVTDMSRMFADCSRIKELDLSSFDTGNVKTMGGGAYYGMFQGCNALQSLDISSFNTSNVENFGNMFYGCSSLTNLDISHFDTSKAISMASMFMDCCNLTSLDVSHFNTESVEDMSHMFSGCKGLTSLDISNFNTDNVTRMSYMFYNCIGLTSLDVSQFVTSKVSGLDYGIDGMEYMFYGCSSLTSLDVSHFDTQKVTAMDGMFSGCSDLTSLDVSNFNTGKVVSMCNMFSGCSKLKSIDLSHFDTSNVTNMGWMFKDCTSLEVLDLSNFDTSKVTSYISSIFNNCNNLVTIYVVKDWALESGYDMFAGCEKLIGGKGTKYDPEHTDYTYARIDGGESAPGYLSLKPEVIIEKGIEYLEKEDGVAVITGAEVPSDGNVIIEGTVIVNGKEVVVKAIDEGAFENNTEMIGITIPETIISIGDMAFAGCLYLKEIRVYAVEPIPLGSYVDTSIENLNFATVFDGVDKETCVLYVPAGSKEKYENAEGWKEFKNIVEMGGPESITISGAKQVTYMSDKDLDFTGYPDLKAYVATGYDKTSGTIWLTRVKEVPANTGFLLMGEADTYEIPVKAGGLSAYYQNMFKGTLEATTIYTTDGNYTNYYLSNGESGVGFYKVTKPEGQSIGANRAYLPLPTEIPVIGSEGSTEMIKVSSAGQVPYYNTESLDFSSLDAQGVKAYTATGYDYNSGTIWLTRVKQVPAKTGILIMAPEGEYPVPTVSVSSVYANMFRGTLEGTTIQTHEEIDGKDYINYYLSSGTSGVGFYRVTKEEGVKIGANRCYLPILNKDAAAGTRSTSSDVNQIAFEEADEVIGIPLLRGIGGDEDGTTSIKGLTPALSEGEGAWYTLQGQRVAKPGKGLYIRNGKKVVIK